MASKIREFGTVVAGKVYALRRGGYGVVRDAAGAVAIVATPRGAFLLGGGQEGIESPEQALIREAREECGCTLKIGALLAVADELLFAKEERAYFRKRGAFFSADIVAHNAALAVEADHALVWLPVEDATRRLVHESHRWAVLVAMNHSKRKGRTRRVSPCASRVADLER